MVTNPFDSEPLEVKITQNRIAPRKPVYNPGKLLDYIKGNGHQFTSKDLEEYFQGNKLLSMCADADLEVSGLTEPTGEFRQYSERKDVVYAVYRLTKLGREVDYASLKPRPSITEIKIPPVIISMINRVIEQGCNPEEREELLEKELKNISPEESEKIRTHFMKLQYPTYNSQ